jgi:hypothetical protein
MRKEISKASKNKNYKMKNYFKCLAVVPRQVTPNQIVFNQFYLIDCVGNAFFSRSKNWLVSEFTEEQNDNVGKILIRGRATNCLIFAVGKIRSFETEEQALRYLSVLSQIEGKKIN